MPETPQSLIAFCREGRRVCPMPKSWNALFEMLPNRKRTALGWEPPLPLILEAWDSTPAPLKTLRLAEHIEWATEQGALDAISAFLRALPESEWLHTGS
ncbi:MAG: hypothetical protein ABIZ09_20370 [Rhodoferax sp.]|jgi:hypothetical protein